MTTKRSRILDEIYLRLYDKTSAGTRVYRGRTKFDDQDDYPVITILSGESQVTDLQGERELIDWPISITSVVPANLDNPSDTVEPLLGEIKTNLFVSDADETLDGKCTKLIHIGDGPDENDDDIYASAAVRVVVRYIEHVGNPAL